MNMIYIVEDDVDIRELESYALKNSGYEVMAFEDSTEFYDACESNIPSLILLDIMLPKEDGLSILKKILKYFLNNLKVCFYNILYC